MKSLEVESSGRLHHLDALRGVAALSVLIRHVFGIYPHFESWTLIMGRPAVTFFFLLSGYVLGKSLSSSGARPVVDGTCYCVRRVFRLYPALLVALIVAAILAKFYVIPQPSAELSGWFSKCIVKATTIHGLHDYLGSLRLYYLRLDPPLWTIQIEFVCSFLLLFLVWTTKSHPLLRWMLVALLGYVRFTHSAWIGMAAYIFEFFLGYIAWTLSPRVGEFSPLKSKYITMGVFLGTFVWMWLRDRSGVGLISVLGMAALLAFAGPCRWQSLKSVLNTAPLQFLGRISYSLYLVHLPILMICWSLIIGRWGAIHGDLRQVMILLLTVLPISLILASLIEGFVERPFNNWGHWISRGIKNFLNPAGLS